MWCALTPANWGNFCANRMRARIISIVPPAAFFHAVWNASVKLGDDKILPLAGMQAASLLPVTPRTPLR